MSKRTALYERWKTVDQAITDLITGAQSATVSSGGGSKSYTRASLSELRKERTELACQIASLDRGGRPRILRVHVETEQ